MASGKLIRFETLMPHIDSGEPGGLFTMLDDLRERPDLSEGDHQRLESLVAWFAKNLQRPTRFSSSRSKGAARRATRGISWFKPEALEHLEKAREFIALVREYGYEIKQIETTRAGKVVYEDEYQIVAESFRDTR
jgi:hypothetical protein